MDEALTLGVIVTIYTVGMATGILAVAVGMALRERSRELPVPDLVQRVTLSEIDFDAEQFALWAERGGRN